MVLKVLDAAGNGRISDVIAALDRVLARKDALNIRVVNLSVAAGVYESYDTDPLTLAAKRVVDAGIVVVAAAGNGGRNSDGPPLYGGVTAPANAPWVLTVGASNHQGTSDVADDTVAVFSSRGPAAITNNAKPDIVAPGVGIESLITPESALYTTRAAFLLPGTVPTDYMPYMSLSGTSMSAPVVSGTVALMFQANPALTPNAVKAILQYTARGVRRVRPPHAGRGLRQCRRRRGARAIFCGSSRNSLSVVHGLVGQLIWGNQLLSQGRLMPGANAWAPDVTWGAVRTPPGEQSNGASARTMTQTWGDLLRRSACTHDQVGLRHAAERRLGLDVRRR